MPAAPKRRWFRFSLRTLLVVVTVFACWLGYEWKWIKQRDEFLAWRDNQERITSARRFAFVSPFIEQEPPRQPSLHLRLVLWVFGRPQIDFLQLCFIADDGNVKLAAHDEHIERAVNLFPEAVIAVAVKHNEPQQ